MKNARKGRPAVKLSPAQFGLLRTLREFGPQSAIEVAMPPAMDGSACTKIEGNIAAATLNRLLDAGMVSVERKLLPRLVNAVGKPGRRRVSLTISITDAGREALDAS